MKAKNSMTKENDFNWGWGKDVDVEMYSLNLSQQLTPPQSHTSGEKG